MAAIENLSAEDVEFLAKCEEEFKDRFTEKDEEFMKVFNAELSVPPIVKSWWVPQNSGRRNDRRNNRRINPYERPGNRDNDRRDYRDRRDDRRDNYGRRDNYDRRGNNDYNRGYNNRGGYGRQYR